MAGQAVYYAFNNTTTIFVCDSKNSRKSKYTYIFWILIKEEFYELELRWWPFKTRKYGIEHCVGTWTHNWTPKIWWHNLKVIEGTREISPSPEFCHPPCNMSDTIIKSRYRTDDFWESSHQPKKQKEQNTIKVNTSPPTILMLALPTPLMSRPTFYYNY